MILSSSNSLLSLATSFTIAALALPPPIWLQPYRMLFDIADSTLTACSDSVATFNFGSAFGFKTVLVLSSRFQSDNYFQHSLSLYRGPQIQLSSRLIVGCLCSTGRRPSASSLFAVDPQSSNLSRQLSSNSISSDFTTVSSFSGNRAHTQQPYLHP